MTPFSSAILLILTWGLRNILRRRGQKNKGILKAPLNCNFMSKLLDFFIYLGTVTDQENDTHYNFCCVKGEEDLEVVLPERQLIA